jgi:hypothetical protein
MVAVATLQACVFPTDDSDALSVRIDALSTTVIRGEALLLHASAVSREPSGTASRPGVVTFTWSSDDERIATVTAGNDGYATVQGINPGRVTIRAVARDYRNAEPGTRTIRVSNTVAIDSVVPDTVRYGEQVTIHGVGLGRVNQLILEQTALIPDLASFAGDALGEGSIRYWVPYPARSGHALAIATDGFSAPAATPTVVVPENVYHSAGGLPTVIDLDGPALAEDGTLFYDPALALTPDAGVNTFHLARSDTTRPLTSVVSTSEPVVRNIQPTISLPGDFSPDPVDYLGWRIGTSEQLCQRVFLASAPDLDFESRPAAVIRSLQQTFREGLDLRIAGESPGRYSLRILDGYFPPDPRLAPDRFEENDYCDGADLNFADPAKSLDLVTGVSEILTIDQPFDLDWYRFSLPGAPEGARLVTIRTTSLPFSAGDSSNIGIGLVSLDSLFGCCAEGWTAEARAPGSSEQLSLELPAGDYYLVVADEAGVATRYALCAAMGNDCVLPSPPPTPGVRRVPPRPR